MPIRDLLDRLERDEQQFVGREFLAPLTGAGGATVRITGIVCRIVDLAGVPSGFRGYAVLRARSTRAADFVRAAGLAEIAAYLSLLPATSLALVHREDGVWYALSAQAGDRRFRISGPVRLELAEEGLELFETVRARFDGRYFWHEQRDPARNPAIAAYLREQAARKDAGGLPPPPESLHAPGLSREERDAYAFVRALSVQAQRDRVEVRLSAALAHAGAELRSYVEQAGAYVVRYTVDGQQFASTIRRDDLTIMAAGICLSGGDRSFDLASLVGVLREGRDSGQIVRVDGERDAD